MPPKGSSTAIKPISLPPLPRLRLKAPSQNRENGCNVAMSSVLNCWASSGYSAEGCINLEQSLRRCMDNQPPRVAKKDTFNYHLARLYPKIVGPNKLHGPRQKK